MNKAEEPHADEQMKDVALRVEPEETGDWSTVVHVKNKDGSMEQIKLHFSRPSVLFSRRVVRAE